MELPAAGGLVEPAADPDDEPPLDLPGGDARHPRSWFTSPNHIPALFFAICDAIDAWDYMAGLIGAPTGQLRGPRDHRSSIDADRLLLAYPLVEATLEANEAGARPAAYPAGPAPGGAPEIP